MALARPGAGLIGDRRGLRRKARRLEGVASARARGARRAAWRDGPELARLGGRRGQRRRRPPARRRPGSPPIRTWREVAPWARRGRPRGGRSRPTFRAWRRRGRGKPGAGRCGRARARRAHRRAIVEQTRRARSPTSRPPSARQSSAASRWASSCWNGGLTRATWNAPEEGRMSRRCAASCWERAAAGEQAFEQAEAAGRDLVEGAGRRRRPRRGSPAGPCRPRVPAPGRPGAPGRPATARAPSWGGVENWSSATCSSLRREWVRLRSARLASRAAISAGASSSRPICGARRRSCRTSAASIAS